MARQFGIISAPSGTITSMVVNGVTKSNSVETAQARDESGKVTDFQAYSKTITLTIRGLLDASAPSVDAGSVIVISGSTCLVTSAEITESNTSFVEYSITATTSDGCVPVAYSAE